MVEQRNTNAISSFTISSGEGARRGVLLCALWSRVPSRASHRTVLRLINVVPFSGGCIAARGGQLRRFRPSQFQQLLGSSARTAHDDAWIHGSDLTNVGCNVTVILVWTGDAEGAEIWKGSTEGRSWGWFLSYKYPPVATATVQLRPPPLLRSSYPGPRRRSVPAAPFLELSRCPSRPAVLLCPLRSVLDAGI